MNQHHTNNDALISAGAAYVAASLWRRTDARRAQGLPEDELDRMFDLSKTPLPNGADR